MALDLIKATYNPDVLSCLANLSNDEVFTPPEVVNQMLDMLPQELFSNPDTTFLDPATKSGVFLREIAKRLMVGLEKQIPDVQERVDHIFKKQLFGIAITELTSLLARRSVYCSKYPNSSFSVTKFDTPEGNIRYRRIQHSWKDGKCEYCGASMGEYDRGDDFETHAYEWIHRNNPERIWENMKFDVIISNPPYQLSDGGSKASAKPIYQNFVQSAKKLLPRYIVMIIPARWFSGGKGLDEFRNDMLKDNHITEIVDYFDSTECFPGVDISGGICYFCWDRDKQCNCKITSHKMGSVSVMERPLLEDGSNTFVRFNEAVTIARKVSAYEEKSFSERISARKPFGLETNVSISQEPTSMDSIKIFAFPKNGYISRRRVLVHENWIDKIKVCISYAYGERGDFPYQVIGRPFIAMPGTCCTETYLVVSVCDTVEEANNIISYMSTDFFRFLVLLKKNTQHATKNVYELVPEQDFSQKWDNNKLYKKYNLSEDEIRFIESMIKPFAGGDE